MLLAIKEKIRNLLISFSVKKGPVYAIGILFVLASTLFFTGGAHADKLADYFYSPVSGVLILLATLCIKLTLFILSFMIEIAGYNGFLDLDAVNTAWVLVRDFANMGFMVVLLIIAFGTILGLESYEWKKMLPKLVFSAVIVNFSRVICGALIDVSQILMNAFLNGIAATAGGNIITMFNLTSIKDLAGGVSANDYSQIGATFAACLAAFVFSALIMVILGTFLLLLVKRVVYLWVLIVISPLAFVLDVLPQTEDFSKKWWNKFNDHLVTGPVLLFFLWLSLIIFGSGNIATHLADKSYIDDSLKIREGISLEADRFGSQNAGIGQALVWTQMINMLLAIAFLFIGAVIAEEIGESGAGLLGRLTEVAEFVAGVWIAKKGYDAIKGGAVDLAAGVYNRTLGIPVQGVQGAILDAQIAWNNRMGGASASGLGRVLQFGAHDRAAHARHEILESKRDTLKNTAGMSHGLEHKEHDAKIQQNETKRILESLNEGAMADAMKKGLEKQTNALTEIFNKQKKEKEAATGVKMTQKAEVEMLRKILDDNKGKFTGLRALEEEAKRRAAKSSQEKLEEQAIGAARDREAITKNKPAIYLNRVLQSQHRDKMEDFSALSYEELKDMKNNFETGVQTAYTDLESFRATSPTDEAGIKAREGVYAKAVENMTMLATAFSEKGNGVELVESDSDKVHMDLLAKLTGVSRAGMDPVAVEQQLRKALGDKADIMIRNLGSALDHNASSTGHFQLNHQVTLGRDENGKLVHGFTNNMVAGTAGTTMAGVPQFATGSPTTDGVERQRSKEGYARDTVSGIHSSDDGRGIFITDGKSGQATAIYEQARAQIKKIADMRDHELRNLKTSLLNLFSGGTLTQSSYHSTTQDFVIAAPEVAANFKDVMDTMILRLRQAQATGGTPQEIERRKEAITALLKRVGDEKIKTFEDISADGGGTFKIKINGKAIGTP